MEVTGNDDILWRLINSLDDLEPSRYYTGREIIDTFAEPILHRYPFKDAFGYWAKDFQHSPESLKVAALRKEIAELKTWRGMFKTVRHKLFGAFQEGYVGGEW